MMRGHRLTAEEVNEAVPRQLKPASHSSDPFPQVGQEIAEGDET